MKHKVECEIEIDEKTGEIVIHIPDIRLPLPQVNGKVRMPRDTPVNRIGKVYLEYHPQAHITEKQKTQMRKLLRQGYKEHQIIEAIHGIHTSKWHIENEQLGLDLILKEDKIESYRSKWHKHQAETETKEIREEHDPFDKWRNKYCAFLRSKNEEIPEDDEMMRRFKLMTLRRAVEE